MVGGAWLRAPLLQDEGSNIEGRQIKDVWLSIIDNSSVIEIILDYYDSKVRRRSLTVMKSMSLYGLNKSPLRKPSQIPVAKFSVMVDNEKDIAVASAAPQIPKRGIKHRLSNILARTLIVNSIL